MDAQRWLATQLKVAIEQVQIVEVEQAEWTDSCLGLGRLNESCLQVITPGWRVIFEINRQPYEVRTNETGSTIRLATPEGTPGAEVTLENTYWSFVSFGSPGGEQRQSMSMIPKETGLNFGQEGRRLNVCGNGAEDGFFIGYIFPVSGELQRASHTLTTCDQLSNFQFDLHPDGKPVIGNIN